MTVTFKKGNMFDEPADAIVNTVNCVGVMGKGVALEFKRRWPQNFKAYKDLCNARALRPGHMFVYRNDDLLDRDAPAFLVNFPTKDHWRGKSQISYIVDGLDDLVQKIQEYRIKSIVVPPLGCGNGGLDWTDVKPIIQEKLSKLDAAVIVFEPAPEKAMSTPVKMTFERAVLLRAMGDFAIHFGGEYTRITLHKLAYFLQVLGLDLKFEFERNAFGPYSEKLKAAFLAMEKTGLIHGFSSGDQLTEVDPAAYAQALDYLDQVDGARADDILKKLDFLIDGYESPYGMELLSSVHYLNSSEDKRSVGDILSALRTWNDRKGVEFQESSVARAFDRLKSDGLAA